jgi:hypothetical protein
MTDTSREGVMVVGSEIPGFSIKSLGAEKAEDWSEADNPPWQNAHRHMSLLEVYTVVSGWMLVVYKDSNSDHVVKLLTTETGNNSITILPRIAHNVLLGPGAEIVVWQQGDIDRKISKFDRLPAPDFDFDYTQLEGIITDRLK